jgi:hypothetical protein
MSTFYRCLLSTHVSTVCRKYLHSKAHTNRCLGVVMFELLTGQPPFRAATIEATVDNILESKAMPCRAPMYSD